MEVPTYAVAAVRQSQQASQYTESPRHGRHKRPWPKTSLVRARVDEICRGTRREQEKAESRECKVTGNYAERQSWQKTEQSTVPVSLTLEPTVSQQRSTISKHNNNSKCWGQGRSDRPSAILNWPKLCSASKAQALFSLSW